MRENLAISDESTELRGEEEEECEEEDEVEKGLEGHECCGQLEGWFEGSATPCARRRRSEAPRGLKVAGVAGEQSGLQIIVRVMQRAIGDACRAISCEAAWSRERNMAERR